MIRLTLGMVALGVLGAVYSGCVAASEPTEASSARIEGEGPFAALTRTRIAELPEGRLRIDGHVILDTLMGRLPTSADDWQSCGQEGRSYILDQNLGLRRTSLGGAWSGLSVSLDGKWAGAAGRLGGTRTECEARPRQLYRISVAAPDEAPQPIGEPSAALRWDFLGETAFTVVPGHVKGFDLATGQERWSLAIGGEWHPGWLTSPKGDRAVFFTKGEAETVDASGNAHAITPYPPFGVEREPTLRFTRDGALLIGQCKPFGLDYVCNLYRVGADGAATLVAEKLRASSVASRDGSKLLTFMGSGFSGCIVGSPMQLPPQLQAVDLASGTRTMLPGVEDAYYGGFTADGKSVWARGQVMRQVCGDRMPATCSAWSLEAPNERKDLVPSNLFFGESYQVGSTVYTPSSCGEVPGYGFYFTAQTRSGDRQSMRAYVRSGFDGKVKDLGVSRPYEHGYETTTFLAAPDPSNRRATAIVRGEHSEAWLVSGSHRQACKRLKGDVNWSNPAVVWAKGIVYYEDSSWDLHARTVDGRYGVDLPGGQYAFLDGVLYQTVREGDATALYRMELPSYEPVGDPLGDEVNPDCKDDPPPTPPDAGPRPPDVGPTPPDAGRPPPDAGPTPPPPRDAGRPDDGGRQPPDVTPKPKDREGPRSSSPTVGGDGDSRPPQAPPRIEVDACSVGAAGASRAGHTWLGVGVLAAFAALARRRRSLRA